ncbi:MAG: CAP domain-containing protein [Sneathiella sp.]
MDINNELTMLINRAREENNLPPVRQASKLDTAAELHAAYMLQKGILSHSGRNNSSFDDRIQNEDYAFKSAAENVAFGANSAKAVLALWMDSPPHQANLLNEDFTEIGIGIAPTLSARPDATERYWSLSLAAPFLPAGGAPSEEHTFEAEPLPVTTSTDPSDPGGGDLP